MKSVCLHVCLFHCRQMRTAETCTWHARQTMHCTRCVASLYHPLSRCISLSLAVSLFLSLCFVCFHHWLYLLTNAYVSTEITRHSHITLTRPARSPNNSLCDLALKIKLTRLCFRQSVRCTCCRTIIMQCDCSSVQWTLERYSRTTTWQLAQTHELSLHLIISRKFIVI